MQCVETAEEIRGRVLEAARDIPPGQPGTCGDRGFSQFSDEASTSREITFEKIRARVRGTQRAAEVLGEE
jgi:5-methyltetrahydropteroyltriglutamate--homocysteine methyltransferase